MSDAEVKELRAAIKQQELELNKHLTASKFLEERFDARDEAMVKAIEDMRDTWQKHTEEEMDKFQAILEDLRASNEREALRDKHEALRDQKLKWFIVAAGTVGTVALSVIGGLLYYIAALLKLLGGLDA